MVMNIGLRPTMEVCCHLSPHHDDSPGAPPACHDREGFAHLVGLELGLSCIG